MPCIVSVVGILFKCFLIKLIWNVIYFWCQFNHLVQIISLVDMFSFTSLILNILCFRNVEDFVTWTHTSAIRKHVMEYNEMVNYHTGFSWINLLNNTEQNVDSNVLRWTWLVIALQQLLRFMILIRSYCNFSAFLFKILWHTVVMMCYFVLVYVFFYCIERWLWHSCLKKRLNLYWTWSADSVHP